MKTKILHKLIALLLIVGLNGVAIFRVGYTAAYYNDVEGSTENIFSAASLDFSLASASDFTPDVDPETDASRTVTISNDGSLGFQYTASTTNVIGALCSSLNLVAKLDGTEEYNGPLSGFNGGPFVFSDPDEWDFITSLTSDDPELADEICNFDFEYSGWQEDLAGPPPAGFSDIETISNTVTAGTWGGEPLAVAEFAVFGASDVSDTHETETGSNTDIFSGLIGSNRSVDLGSGNFGFGIRAGANVTTGSNADIGTEGIIANGFVSLGSGTDVLGETHGISITTGSNAKLHGKVVSGGALSLGSGTEVDVGVYVDATSATLGSNADIFGTLTLPLAVTPTLGSGATVGTLVNSGTPPPATPDTFVDISLPTPNVFGASTDAGDDIDITSGNSPLSLAPGIYRDLTSNSNRTLNLTAGTYVFRSIDLESGNIINANVSGGEILIFVEGNVTTSSNLSFNLTGGTADKVYLESGGIVNLGSGNDWYGTIYSTKSNDPAQFGVVTDSNVDVWGALYSAEQIKLGSGNNITLVGPIFGSYIAPSVIPGVVINEIYPYPAGGAAPSDREWIELYNNSGSSVDVLGWKISEMSGSNEAFYTIVASGAGSGQVQPYAGASTVISAGGLLILEFSATNKLNNPGDTVRLYGNSNTFMDGHAYPSTVVGKSHQRIPDGGIWVDPEPTPGAPNRVSMQDLIDAGLDEETIQVIISLLREKGETLLSEEPNPEITLIEKLGEEITGLLPDFFEEEPVLEPEVVEDVTSTEAVPEESLEETTPASAENPGETQEETGETIIIREEDILPLVALPEETPVVVEPEPVIIPEEPAPTDSTPSTDSGQASSPQAE